jgi:hypothetical protein
MSLTYIPSWLTRTNRLLNNFQIDIYSLIATLRYAISWKILTKNNLTKNNLTKNNLTKINLIKINLTTQNFKKKILKIFREIVFQFFFGYHGSTSNLEYACENLGGLGPLVWEEIENEQTVHKGLAKLLYR